MAVGHLKIVIVLCMFVIVSLILTILNIQSTSVSRVPAKTTSDIHKHFNASSGMPKILPPLQGEVTIFSNEGTCAKTLVREIVRDATWQPVDKDKKIYMISAYFINKQGKVYIIGAKPMYDVSVVCQLWVKKGDKSYVMLQETDVKVGTPNDPAGPLPFTAAIFECALKSTVVPTHVSVVPQRCDTPQNLVYIHNASEPAAYKRRFTVCLAPIFSYGAAQSLIEWIELNRILGVDKFIVYNYSTSMNVDKVLYHYLKQGLVEIIQWRLPFLVTNHIHYFGQTAALNDCLFRNKQVSEFITNIDIDEFIVPHSKDVYNWPQMLKLLNNGSDGYLFRNTFFRKEWTASIRDLKQKENFEKFPLITMKHIEREEKIYPLYDRGKYFARTARAHYTLIHEIPHLKVQTVLPEVGLLHHYRNWQNYKDRQLRVKDLTIPEKFGDILLKNAQKIWNELGKVNVSLDISEI